MAEYRGFEGQVPEMSGLGWNGNMYNAQGNYDQGRGPDGLSAAKPYKASRCGTGTATSSRPPAISGKPRPPAMLDPAPYIPTLVQRMKIDAKRQRARLVPTRRRPINKASMLRQRQRFVNWLKNYSPQLYAAAKRKADVIERSAGRQLGELSGWFDSFTDSLKDLGGNYLQYKTQKEILDVQLERMRAGLPPLETSQYAPTIAIKPDPGTVREITGAIGAGFGKMLPFIAIGGAALFLMMRRRPARG